MTGTQITYLIFALEKLIKLTLISTEWIQIFH